MWFRRKFIAVALLFLTSQPVFAINSVSVMADNSLSIVITQIARQYSRERNMVVNTSFASPKAQQVQITEGGDADILITPIVQWLDDLKMQGVVDLQSQTVVARNQLALIGPLESMLTINLNEKFPVAEIIREIGADPGFAMGSPETLQSGSFAKEALRNLQVADLLEPYTLYIKQTDEIFHVVASQKAYGMVFYSATVGHAGVKVLDVVPETTHRPILYYAVVLAGDNMNEARKFLDYLKSDTARRLFIANGFLVD